MENKKLFEDGSLREKYTVLKESLHSKARYISEVMEKDTIGKELNFDTFKPAKVATFEKLISRNSSSVGEFYNTLEKAIQNTELEIQRTSPSYGNRMEFQFKTTVPFLNARGEHIRTVTRTFNLSPHVDEFRNLCEAFFSMFGENMMDGKPLCENWNPNPWLHNDLSRGYYGRPATFQNYMFHKAWVNLGRMFLERRIALLKTHVHLYTFEEFQKDAIAAAVRKVYEIASETGVPVTEVYEALASDLTLHSIKIVSAL